MVGLADILSEAIGSSEKHPLLDLFELTSDYIRAYDLDHLETPDANPQ
jgi:HTH-type transcriptional regulator/antitoxin HigA